MIIYAGKHKMGSNPSQSSSPRSLQKSWDAAGFDCSICESAGPPLKAAAPCRPRVSNGWNGPIDWDSWDRWFDDKRHHRTYFQYSSASANSLGFCSLQLNRKKKDVSVLGNNTWQVPFVEWMNQCWMKWELKAILPENFGVIKDG